MSSRRLQSVERDMRPLLMWIVVTCALLGAACGGGGRATEEQTPTSPTRSAPPPRPTARIELDGNGQLMTCVAITQRVIRCDFSESGRNAGPGCAVDVRGRVRLVSGETDFAGQPWSLSSTRVLMPEEQFSYTVKIDAAPDAFKGMTGYRTDAEWTNTACP